MTTEETGNLTLQQFKLQKQLKELEGLKGEGTSLISLYIPAGGQIPIYQKMITAEMSAASCIKSRIVRSNVLTALTSLQQRLKLIKTPKKGLVLFCGIAGEDQKKKFCIIEPLKTLTKSSYLCDSQFHTEYLREQLDDGKKYGFIIVDGNGALFGQIKGNTKEILHKFSVDLPKKHNKGGQSAAYLRKVGEISRSLFISNNERCNVEAIVLAGSADLKDHFEDHIFDIRISSKIIASFDISQGGENGFKQAIQMSSKLLENNRLVQESKVATRYFELIAKGSTLIKFGVKDSMESVDQSLVDTLIVWEKLDVLLYTLENKKNQKKKVVYKSADFANRRLKNWEVISSVPLIDWLFGLDLIDNEEDFKTEQQIENEVANRLNGARLEIISDHSSEGAQFCRSFGGIGAILRYSSQCDEYDEYYSVTDDDHTDSSDYSEDEDEGDEDGKEEDDVSKKEENDSILIEEIPQLNFDLSDEPNDLTTSQIEIVEVNDDQQTIAPVQTSAISPPVRKRVFDANAPVFVPSFMRF